MALNYSALSRYDIVDHWLKGISHFLAQGYSLLKDTFNEGLCRFNFCCSGILGCRIYL